MEQVPERETGREEDWNETVEITEESQADTQLYIEELEEAIDLAEKEIRRSRRSGFLNGVLAVLCIGILVRFGQGFLGKNAETLLEELGAEALTDERTEDKLEEVEKIIEKHYLKDVDGELLTDYMMKGIAVGLDDPYASYYSAEELQAVMDSSNGEYYGIGVTLSQDPDTWAISVAQVYEDSPADKAGLQVDDVVKKVNDESVVGIDLSDLVTLIKGLEEEFSLTVYRPHTEEEIEVTLVCDHVEIYQVDYEMLESKIGYIQLTEFTQSAVHQVEDALLDLKSQGMEKLIVDLRGNPGGLLTSVCDIVDFFLDDGLIVYMEDKNGKREEYYAEQGQIVDCETAVLVNGYSASASEIFAGVIQDYELGPVVGTQTFGKGLVQVTYPLSDGSAFKLTVQQYFTAGGQDIDGNGGITPDIIIEETGSDAAAAGDADEVLQAAIDALQEE